MRVAVATGRRPFDVLRDPYHETLYTFLHLRQHERLEQFAASAQGLRQAGRIAIAFHEPDKLRGEHERLLREAGMTPTAEDALATAQQMIADMAKIDAAHAEGTDG